MKEYKRKIKRRICGYYCAICGQRLRRDVEGHYCGSSRCENGLNGKGMNCKCET